MSLDKARVIAALLKGLENELGAVERVAEMARDEATNSETKAEGKYDTRATEASYLARGQATRIAELRRLRAWYRQLVQAQLDARPQVGIGSLVQLMGERAEWVFLAPSGGGKVELDGQRIRVISLSSPLGSALAEQEAGDGVEVDTPRGLNELEILQVL